MLALDDGTRCVEARGSAEQKLEDVRAKLEDLRRIESVLARLVDRRGSARGNVTCPLIAALHAI